MDLPGKTRVRLTRAAVTAHPLEFEVSRGRTSQLQGVSCRRSSYVEWPLSYTVFDTRTTDICLWGSQPLVASLSWAFSVFRGAGACGVAKAICKKIFFPLGSVLLDLIIK